LAEVAYCDQDARECDAGRLEITAKNSAEVKSFNGGRMIKQVIIVLDRLVKQPRVFKCAAAF
jgi:hypothetical protein